jgi:hypothetical protein
MSEFEAAAGMNFAGDRSEIAAGIDLAAWPVSNGVPVPCGGAAAAGARGLGAWHAAYDDPSSLLSAQLRRPGLGSRLRRRA